MRRLIKVLFVTGLLAAICAPAAGANARAPALCPGTGGYCCGPPTGQCCVPIPIPCTTTTISISVVPDPSRATQRVEISGSAGSAAPAGTTVTLWQELAGQTKFTSVATNTTDSSGNYAFTRAAPTNRSWYVTVGTGRSVTVVQRVEAAITLKALVARATNGKMVTFAGKVTPSHAGERIRIERRVGGAWVVIATATLNHASTFRTRKHFSGSGKADVRAVLGGDRRNVKSYSATVKTAI